VSARGATAAVPVRYASPAKHAIWHGAIEFHVIQAQRPEFLQNAEIQIESKSRARRMQQDMDSAQQVLHAPSNMLACWTAAISR
jgi:hypothetical protein